MIRNPTPPPPPHAPIAQTNPGDETEDARAARIRALRDAYLAGNLDLTIPDEGAGLRRLLRDVFSGSAGPRRP